MTFCIIPAAFDGILSFIAAFAVVFSLIRTTSLPLWADYLVAVTLSFSVAAAAFTFAFRQRRAENLIKAAPDLKARMHIFNVCTLDENLNFFCAVFNKMHIDTYVEGDFLVTKNAKSALCFTPEPTDANELYLLFCREPSNGEKRLAALGSEFTLSAKQFAISRSITLFSALSVVDMLEKAKSLQQVKSPAKRNLFKEYVSAFLSRRNGRRYVLFGASLLIMAAFVFYPVYYYIVGGAFVVFGVVSSLFPRAEKSHSEPTISEFLASENGADT